MAKIEYSLDGANWIVYSTSFTITSEGTTTVYYKSTDNLNNIELPKSLEIKIDKTQPTITAQSQPQANSSGWNNTDTTVTFTATDILSGVVQVTQPQIITIEGVNQHIGAEAIDLAGNQATTYVIINLDKTAPQITITTPAGQAEYLLNQLVTANWTVLDSLSGIDSSSATVPSGQVMDTSSAGVKTFKVSSLDNAGNQIEKLTTYYVRYNFGGILLPINPDGSSIFKLGRAVPVKFQLKDSSGNFISTATAKIYLTKTNDNVTGIQIEAESVGEANTGNLFRYDAAENQYIFNLGTKGLSGGTWQIKISLDDGSLKYVNISLR